MADIYQAPRLDVYAQDLLQQTYGQNPISADEIQRFSQGLVKINPPPPQVEQYARPTAPSMQPNQGRVDYMKLVENRFNEIAAATGGVEALAYTGRLEKAQQKALKDIEMQYGPPPEIYVEPNTYNINGTQIVAGGQFKTPVVLPSAEERTLEQLKIQAEEANIAETKRKTKEAKRETQEKIFTGISNAESAVRDTTNAISNIDNLLTHPKLAEGLGFNALFSFIPESEALNIKTRIKQISGQNFLNAFEKLKGAGAITEVEGQKAEQASARIDQYLSKDNFQEAMRELRQWYTFAQEKGMQKADFYSGQLKGKMRKQYQRTQEDTSPNTPPPELPAAPEIPSVSSPGAVTIDFDPTTRKPSIRK